MSILAGYIIIVFLFFLGFSLFDFIAYNSNFNLKKAIKHPFSLFFCFLFHTITENDKCLIEFEQKFPDEDA